MLLKPYFTEKTLKSANSNCYTFIAPVKMTKGQVKAVIESLYKVNVKRVTTSLKKGTKQMARGTSRRYFTSTTSKKVNVFLKDKQTLDLFKTK